MHLFWASSVFLLGLSGFFSPVKFLLPSAVIYVLLTLHVLEVDLQLMSHMCAAVMSRRK